MSSLPTQYLIIDTQEKLLNLITELTERRLRWQAGTHTPGWSIEFEVSPNSTFWERYNNE